MISEYKPVIDGQQRTVKVTRKQARTAADFGLRTKGDRVIIDNTPGMHIIKDKKDSFGYRLRFADGVQAINLPTKKGRTFDVFLDRVEKELKGQRGRISFSIQGYKSKQTFHNFEQARRYLMSYRSVNDTIGKRKAESDLISLITFYRNPGRRKVKAFEPKRCTAYKGKLRCKREKGHSGAHIFVKNTEEF